MDKPQRGRKPLPKEDKLVGLIVLMRPDERAAIVQGAEAAGQSASAYARAILVAAS
jgi:hypothetical protein